MIKLIKNGTVITMDEDRDKKYEKLDIVIKDNKIIDVNSSYKGPYDELIDATGKIVMPGLINAHTHLGMSIFRATNDNLTLNEWLENKIWPIEDNMTDDDMYYSTLLSCIEMIKTGTTTSNDMYFNWKNELKAIKKSKVRCLFSRALADMHGGGDERLKELKEIIEVTKDNELVTVSVSPHAFYTCSKDYLIKCKKFADKYNLPIHMHFCENEKEVEDIIKDYNMSPAEALDSLGYLNNKLILAHSTILSDKDIKLLKNKDIYLVHNPISNLNLGCGIADIIKYRKNNLNICLGTDGQGSGNNLNMFYHLSLVDLLQKGVYKDPTLLSSYEVLKMATINGAKALNIDNLGIIKKDYLADIIILDLNNIEAYPTVDLINQIVHNTESNNIDTTIINGEVLMRNHKLTIDIDEDRLKEEINKIKTRLF